MNKHTMNIKTDIAKKCVVLAVMALVLAASVMLLNFRPAPVTHPDPLVHPQYAEFLERTGALDEALALAAADEAAESELVIEFSHNKHFYTSDISVRLAAIVQTGAEKEPAPDAVIYYTLDGSEPTVESEVYSEPIPLEAKNNHLTFGAYPLKAIAVYEDVTTRPFVHSYFVSEDIDSRFDVMVVSLSTNNEYLYDYETGIMVEGITRAEYKQENPGVHIEPPAPANFNWRGRESERPIHVEFFEPDGTRVISQAAGVRVHGGWSRAENYKSLRLIARKEYEPLHGRFKYDFFPDDVRADGFGTPIMSYDQLVLSNNANDRNYAMMRQEVNYALARQAGLRVVPSARACAVFLNGMYYGFAWINTGMNEQHLEDIYSAPVRDFQIIGNGEVWIETEDEAEIAAMEHFNSFHDKDFTDDAVLAEFEQLVDLDNLLLYYAYQTYVGNRDWPNNNLKRWRYTGPRTIEEAELWLERHAELAAEQNATAGSDNGATNGGVAADNSATDGAAAAAATAAAPDEPLIDMAAFGNLAPELDGRWRYITYDLDFLMGLYEGSPNANNPSFRDYLNRGSDRYSYMLASLFKRPDIADRYAMIICDLAANVVTEENIAEQIELRYAEAYSEIGHALATFKYPSWVNYRAIESNHANMLEYTRRRANLFIQDMCRYFGWDYRMYNVEVSGDPAIIGSQAATSSSYLAHLKVPVRPNLDAGKYIVFDHWVLNGEKIYTPEITVSVDDAVDWVVSLELVTREEVPALQIIEAFERPQQNGAALRNTTNEAVTTEGLYLTNDLSYPHLWSMPLATVEPGGTLELAGRSSRGASDLMKIQMGFNARIGRVLYLVNDTGDILDWLVVTP